MVSSRRPRRRNDGPRGPYGGRGPHHGGRPQQPWGRADPHRWYYENPFAPLARQGWDPDQWPPLERTRREDGQQTRRARPQQNHTRTGRSAQADRPRGQRGVPHGEIHHAADDGQVRRNQSDSTSGYRGARNEHEQPDAGFVTRIRLVHKLIKGLHHLNNLHTDEPAAIRKLREHLATFIKPAVPCEMTAKLIENNAADWAHTTKVILTDHYEALLAQIQVDLVGHTFEQFDGPFEVATKWARQNLGCRLLNKTIDEAKNFIREQLRSSQPRRWEEQKQDATHSIQPSRPSTSRPRTQRLTISSTSGTQNHQRGQQHTPTEPHGPPTGDNASTSSTSNLQRATQRSEPTPELTTDHQRQNVTNTDEDTNNNSFSVPDRQLAADGEHLDTDITLRTANVDPEENQPGPSTRTVQTGLVLRGRPPPASGIQPNIRSAVGLKRTGKRNHLK